MERQWHADARCPLSPGPCRMPPRKTGSICRWAQVSIAQTAQRKKGFRHPRPRPLKLARLPGLLPQRRHSSFRLAASRHAEDGRRIAAWAVERAEQ